MKSHQFGAPPYMPIPRLTPIVYLYTLDDNTLAEAREALNASAANLPYDPAANLQGEGFVRNPSGELDYIIKVHRPAIEESDDSAPQKKQLQKDARKKRYEAIIEKRQQAVQAPKGIKRKRDVSPEKSGAKSRKLTSQELRDEQLGIDHGCSPQQCQKGQRVSDWLSTVQHETLADVLGRSMDAVNL